MAGPEARYDQMADFYEQRSGKTVSDPATAALIDLTGDGLVLDRAVEPPPSTDMKRRRPRGAAPVPFYFVARAVAPHLAASG